MDKETLENSYLKIIKRCAKFTGIWPEQSKLSKYVMRVIISSFALPAIFTMVARVIMFFSVDAVMEELSFLGVAWVIFLKQGNYVVNDEKYKTFIDYIRRDWSVDRPKEEFDIMFKYADRGMFLCSFYFVNACACVVLFVQTPLTPRILDVVLPKNESRGLVYIYPAYYFVNGDKYYLLINAHMASMIVIVLYVYTCCDTSYMYFVQHGCGLLAVAGYRFKQAIQELNVTKENGNRGDEFYKKVCYAIQGHQYAIKYLKTIEDSHVVYLFICIGFVMVCFSVTLVKVTNTDASVELIRECTFVAIQLMHVFYLTMQGQFVIDANEEIAQSVYDTLWYISDKRTQMLFVLVLRSFISAPRLTAGGLITLNLQSFSEILKASVSYFTVLKST